MFILLEDEFIRFTLCLQHLLGPAGFGFASLHRCCRESVDVYLLKSELIINSWTEEKNGTCKMFSKTPSKWIAKHLGESELQLFSSSSNFNCWLLLETLRCVYSSGFPSLSVSLWSSSLPVGAAVSGTCVHAGLSCHGFSVSLLWFVVGYELKGAVNLSCNQSRALLVGELSF